MAFFFLLKKRNQVGVAVFFRRFQFFQKPINNFTVTFRHCELKK